MHTSTYQTTELNPASLNQIYPHRRDKNCNCALCRSKNRQAQRRRPPLDSTLQEIEEGRTVSLTKTTLSWTGPHLIDRDLSRISGAGIYVVTRNEKPIYVGQTESFSQRFSHLLSSLNQLGCDVRKHKIYLATISLANGSPVTTSVRKHVESVIIRTYMKQSVQLQNRSSINAFKVGSGGLFINNKGRNLPPGLKKIIKHSPDSIFEISKNDQYMSQRPDYKNSSITELFADEEFEFDDIFNDEFELRRRKRSSRNKPVSVSTSQAKFKRRRNPAINRSSSAASINPAHDSEFVRWLQRSLNQVLQLRLRTHGVMNPATRNAIRDFQVQQGLPVTGIAGPEVEQALHESRHSIELSTQDMGEAKEFEFIELETGAGKPMLRHGSRGSDVTDLQRRLNTAGFNAGTVDGIFGSNTDAAVRAFQRSRGLDTDGIVGPMTWGALLSIKKRKRRKPRRRGSSGGGEIRYGKGWGGSEGVADAAKEIAASMGIPVTSEKRNLEETIRLDSKTTSDHYTGNINAFATDLGVRGSRGDELASAIASKYGIPQSSIGTFNRTTIQVQDRRYSLQLLWRVDGHYDHVHLGIRRV